MVGSSSFEAVGVVVGGGGGFEVGGEVLSGESMGAKVGIGWLAALAASMATSWASMRW